MFGNDVYRWLLVLEERMTVVVARDREGLAVRSVDVCILCFKEKQR